MLALTFAQANADIAVGDIPPDFLGNERNGGEIRVNSYRGKVMTVTFWASWCAYCRKELPMLEATQRLSSKDKLQIVAVNFQEDRDAFHATLRYFRDFVMAVTRDADGAISEAYGAHSLPHLLVMDKQGRVAHVHVGYNADVLDKIIDELNALIAQPYEPAPEKTGTAS